MVYYKCVADTNSPDLLKGGGGEKKDFKICMVMMVSAEALQSDLVQIFPNFHDFWQSYCQRYPSPTRKQKP